MSGFYAQLGVFAQQAPPPPDNGPVVNWLSDAADYFISLFRAGGDVFSDLVTGIVPLLIVLLTAVYAVINLVGEQRIHGAARWAGKTALTRYTLLPILAMFFLTNPMAYTFGTFLEERHKPAFYDSAVSFCHPITGLFPHANAAELFVYLGVARGLQKQDLPLGPIAIRYFIAGVIIILIRGIVTEYITKFLAKRSNIELGGHEQWLTIAQYVEKGSGGWGGPLVIEPTAERDKIVAVTGGSIPPVAQQLADMTGATVVDGFRTSVPEEQIAAVVVDCGGTARAGVYPRKRLPTINLTPVGQAGPLAEFIKEDIYVSGVKPENLHPAEEGDGAAAGAGAAGAAAGSASVLPKSPSEAGANPFELSGRVSAGQEAGGFTGVIARMGRAIGRVVGVLFASGRQSVEQVIRNVLPFMAFVAMVIGIINETGLGNRIAEILEPLGGSLPGLLLLSVICSLPFLSPILGPGAVIAQVVGVLIGNEIARGNIDPQYALPALFAYDAQVGCDFIPVGLALGEAKPETVEIGVPAVLFSRVITGPVAVGVAFVLSIGMY